MKTIYQSISPDPTLFDTGKKKTALQKAIRQLSAEQQDILDLHFNQQLSVKQIAEQRNSSMTPVYKRLNIAIYKLKKQFNPQAFAPASEIMYGNK